MRLRGDIEASAGLTAIAVLGLGLLALFVGYRWFWMVWVLGFAVAVPLVAILSEALSGDDSTDVAELPEEDALAVLRDRYARGEIDDAELERRVERLLAVETVEAARAWVEPPDHESDVERA